MKAPYVTALAYALINIKTGNFMYFVGRSARDVWSQVDQAYGGRGDLHAQGWRAKRVRIEEIGP